MIDKQDEVNDYAKRIEAFYKNSSKSIVSHCARNIKRYISAIPKTERAKVKTNARIEALTRLLDKHRQLELF